MSSYFNKTRSWIRQKKKKMPHSHSVEYIQTERLIHATIIEASFTAPLEHIKHSESMMHSTVMFPALNTVTPSEVSIGDNCHNIYSTRCIHPQHGNAIAAQKAIRKLNLLKVNCKSAFNFRDCTTTVPMIALPQF